jgi:hypothetical protein
VFKDFLAIPAAGGNGSTMSFSDFIQSEDSLFAANEFRLVVQPSVSWNMADLVCLASFIMVPQSPIIRLQFLMHL